MDKKEYYIYVKGKAVPVSEEVYKWENRKTGKIKGFKKRGNTSEVSVKNIRNLYSGLVILH